MKETFKATKDRPTEPCREICGESRGTSRIQILATLVFISKTKYITSFIKNAIYDDSLPILRNNDDVFSGWKEHHVENFIEKQYVLLAPVLTFNSDISRHYCLHDKSRMPFLEHLECTSDGAHGKISKVRIHPDHQIWSPFPVMISSYLENITWAYTSSRTQTTQVTITP